MWKRSKVMKMAATARAIVQAVRHHSPLIKFPNRLGVPRPNVQEALMMAAPAQSSGTHSLPPPAVPPAAPLRPLSVDPPRRPADPLDTAASVASLPPSVGDQNDHVCAKYLPNPGKSFLLYSAAFCSS
ncbi:alpha-ketoglutarate dehydrogenase component 4-like isoform X2 [Conger conger]|uniref:alpha-ketoglutarate dehydrogenase component 4-like isoform X2 n=1 Tax=Conger conger TaxID=82655 RepID=UPI002A5AFBA2|nr:alpha-ketoglutarate dehydrogenase component 4-like isoform X2 [Conger conger]